MFELDTSAPITLDDGEYTVVEQRNPYVRLRCTASGDVRDLHVSELARKNVRLDAFARRPDPRQFDRLTPKQTTYTMTWVSHIEELVKGVSPDRPKPRPEYDITCTTQNERVNAKIAELCAAGQPTSRATVMRKIKAYREFGRAGVIDRRLVRTDGPLDRLDPDVKGALCHAIAETTFKSTRTKKHIIVATQAELFKQMGDNAPPLPSLASMYRYIDEIAGGNHTTGSAKTRRSLANRPQRQYGFSDRTLPGMEVQVDSTELDIMVTTASGETVRPTLTIMVDVATRSILASTIRLTAAKGIDHVLLLAQALTPPANRPDATAFRRLVQDASPHASLLDMGTRTALEGTRPFVYPRRIVIDNGRDYLSEVFIAAVEKFGIDLTFSAPYTPTQKANVERTFGSITTLFTQYLPGYTGRSPEHRGHRVEDERLLSVYALYELFDDWVLNVWQNRPHDSLQDRLEPSVRLTPNQVCAMEGELTSTLYLPLTAEDFIGLLPSAFRHVNPAGISYQNRIYDAAALAPMRGEKSRNPSKNGKWEIRFDPYRPLVIWARSPEGTWIECRARNHDSHLNPHRSDLRSNQQPTEREDLAALNAARTGIPMHDGRHDYDPIPEDEYDTDYDSDDDSDSDDDFTEFATYNPEKA